MTSPTRPSFQRLFLRSAGAAGVCLLLLVLRIDGVSMVAHPNRPYAPAYRPAHNTVELLLDAHDGQANAALAMDPTLSRPQGWDGGHGRELAYRAQRPLFGWLAWAGSLGQPGAVGWVLMVLTAIGGGVLVLGCSLAAMAWGRDPRWAVAAIIIPGSLMQYLFGGLADAFGTGLALAGMALWDRRRGWALLALTGAIFCREEFALAVLALGAMELINRRSLRGALTAAVPLGGYAVWIAIVHARVGYWPTGAGHGNLALPWNGIAMAARGWDASDALIAVIGLVLFVLGWTRLRRPEVRWFLAAWAVFAPLMGADVWRVWPDFSRVLLPVYAVGFVALLRPSAGQETAANERAGSSMQHDDTTEAPAAPLVAPAGRSTAPA